MVIPTITKRTRIARDAASVVHADVNVRSVEVNTTDDVIAPVAQAQILTPASDSDLMYIND